MRPFWVDEDYRAGNSGSDRSLLWCEKDYGAVAGFAKVNGGPAEDCGIDHRDYSNETEKGLPSRDEERLQRTYG